MALSPIDTLIDDDVDLTEAIEGSIEGRLDGRLVQDVERDSEKVVIRRALEHVAQNLGLARSRDDAVSTLQRLLCIGFAEPRRAA